MAIPVMWMPDGDDGFDHVCASLNELDGVRVGLLVLDEGDIDSYIAKLLKRVKRASIASRERKEGGWWIVVSMSSIAESN